MSNTFETGAKTAGANNLVLSVLNDGAVYPDRLHCGFAMLQGATHRVSFREIVSAEALKQRLMGGKFKAAEISDAAKLVQAQTIQHCLELIRDNYDPSRNIEVTGRKWRDNINGNTYFSCWVRIPQIDIGHRSISIPFQYGYGDQWQYEAVRTLRAIGLFADLDERTTLNLELPINFNFEGAMLKRFMYDGIYIRN